MATAREVWKDGPALDPYEPDKSLIRSWGGGLESATSALVNGITPQAIKAERTDLYAVAGDFDEGDIGWVLLDPIESRRGIYKIVSGAFVRQSDLPGDVAAAHADEAAESAQEASDFADNASDSAGDAHASYVAADAARDQAAVSAVSAQASADTAIAAAEASGDVEFFDTKADATAAVSGLPNLQIVEVIEDESRGAARTRYRKESGTLVFKIVVGPEVIIPERFTGANDTERWQAAIDYAASRGGGIIRASKASYSLTNLDVTGNYTILDFQNAALTANPTTSGADGAPMIYAHGSVGASKSLTTAVKGSKDVTAAALGGAVAVGDTVIVGDAKHIDSWDEGLAPSPGPGYGGRSEINWVDGVSGNIVTLRNPMGWTLDGTAYLCKLNALKGFKVRKIGELNEVDPGSPFTGDVNVIATTPHIIGAEFCEMPDIENVKADGFQMHVASFRHCISPRTYKLQALNAFRPNSGGHGYGTRFDRCVGGISDAGYGYKLRHLVDDVQSVACRSSNNRAFLTVTASYVTHGLGTRGFVSCDDLSFGGEGYGWQVGNPAFSGDYDTTIVRPIVRGGNTGISFLATAENLKIIDPDIIECTSRSIFMAAGATGLKVRGGRIAAAAGATGTGVLVRWNQAFSDTYGIECRDVEIIDTVFEYAGAAPSYVGVDVNAAGTIRVEAQHNIDANITAAVRVSNYSVSPSEDGVSTPERLFLERNRGRGTGTGRFFRVRVAPSEKYVVNDNFDRGAARIVEIPIINDSIMLDNDFGTDTYSLTGSVKTAVAAGAQIRRNKPSIGYPDRVLNSMVDHLVSKEMTISGDAGTNRQLIFATRQGVGTTVDDYNSASARWIWRCTLDAESGANAGSDLELVARDDSGNALFTILSINRATGNVNFGNASEFAIAGTWDKPARWAGRRVWVDPATNKLYIKTSAPGSVTDGTLIGPP